MSVAKNGVTIRTIEDWEKLAPPKSKIHWKDGRSAKEVARAWLEVRLRKGVRNHFAACGGPVHSSPPLSNRRFF